MFVLFTILPFILINGQELEPFPLRSCHNGWKDYDNYDIFGHDLSFWPASHPTECFHLCDDIDGCYGFSYGEAFVGHRCYFKTEGATQVIQNNDIYSAYRCDITPSPAKDSDEKFYEEIWFYILCGGIGLLILLILIYYCYKRERPVEPIQPVIRFFDITHERERVPIDLEEIGVTCGRLTLSNNNVEIGITGEEGL